MTQPEAPSPREPVEAPVGRDAAMAWIGSWDAQQQEFVPEREERFTALIDAVAEGTGHAEPLVLDQGCGPGSLSVRLLAAPTLARLGGSAG